uniref:hypothetical protein n=1 Tax=Enterococcus durans TaxID=53345 RepID=UPI001E324102
RSTCLEKLMFCNISSFLKLIFFHFSLNNSHFFKNFTKNAKNPAIVTTITGQKSWFVEETS